MPKSLLKTKISQLLGIKRDKIFFNEGEYPMSIDINDKPFISIESYPDTTLLLSLDEGDINIDISLIHILTPEEIANLIVDSMTQIFKMLSRTNDNYLFSLLLKSDSPISLALESEFNTVDNPWQLVSKITNKDNQEFCYFLAESIDMLQ